MDVCGFVTCLGEKVVVRLRSDYAGENSRFPSRAMPLDPEVRNRSKWEQAFGAVWCVILALSMVPMASAAGPSTRLDAPLTARWQGIDLRQAVDRLGQSQRLFVWLDRRVDPSIRLDIAATNVPLSGVLDQIAEQAAAGWTSEGDFLYVGPPESVREFRTLLAIARENTKRLAPGTRKRMERSVVMDIPRLAEPQRVVAQLAEQGGVRVANQDAVPHDLWPRLELPPMSVGEHLALVLVGFDLTWQPDKATNTIRIVPITRPVVLEREYERRQLSHAMDHAAVKAAVRESGSAARVSVAATVEDHEAIRSSARPQPAPREQPATGKQVYSLRAQDQPVGAVLEQLARQLGKKLEVTEELRKSDRWSARVSFDVREADLPELVKAIAKPAGLAAGVSGDSIRVKQEP